MSAISIQTNFSAIISHVRKSTHSLICSIKLRVKQNTDTKYRRHMDTNCLSRCTNVNNSIQMLECFLSVLYRSKSVSFSAFSISWIDWNMFCRVHISFNAIKSRENVSCQIWTLPFLNDYVKFILSFLQLLSAYHHLFSLFHYNLR